MQDPLTVLFGGETKARILKVLASDSGATYHLRGLAQAAGTDSGNTSKTLANLVEAGIVVAHAERPSTRYALNERSPLTQPLRDLFARAGAFMAELRTAADRLDAAYVCIFGSVASATDGVDSDVDVLVVGNVSGLAAQAAFKPVARTHRREINTVAVTVLDFRAHLAARGAFWSSVAEGKRIDLKGNWDNAATGEPTTG